jgi:hypothetical protein
LPFGRGQRHANLVYQDALAHSSGDIEADGLRERQFKTTPVAFAGADHFEVSDRLDRKTRRP